MAITRQKKESVVKDVSDKLKSSQVVIFTDFKGLSVNEMTELRETMLGISGTYQVVKKTLIKRALEENGIEGMDPLNLEGQIGLAFGEKDAVATAKSIYDVQKETGTLTILGGIMEGNILSADEIIRLAQLPSREELLAKLVGSINAPVSGFVNVLAGNMRGLVYALNAIQEKKS